MVDLFRRVYRFLLVYAVVFLVAGTLFYLLESPRYSLADSLYWSIVTLGTVGYGDIVPTTGYAKALASLVIGTQIFLLGYLITVITTAVSEQAQARALGTYGTSWKNHIVVLGYSGVGRAAVRELLVQDQTVAVVSERPEEVANIRTLAGEDRLFVTYGDPAAPEILHRVNVTEAHSVIVCTADDATNMIGALNVRSLAPRARIVVSVGRPELRDTLKAAGVTYVASPADMGGRLCAAAAFEPEVAMAIEDFTAADVRSDIQEYVVRDGSPLAGKSFEEADQRVRTATGCILIGLAHRGPSGEFETVVNPPPASRVEVGDAILLIATIENSEKFRRWFGANQGR